MQKNRLQTYYGRSVKFFWMSYLRNSMNQYIMNFLFLVDYAFSLCFIFFEITFTSIFSKSLLFDCFQESSDHQISLNSVEEYEIAKKNQWLWYVFFSCSKFFQKYHPSK